MNVFCIEAVLTGEQRRLHESRLLRIGVERQEVSCHRRIGLRIPPSAWPVLPGKRPAASCSQLAPSWPRVPGIADFHGAQPRRHRVAKGFELPARNHDAPDGRAFLPGFERHPRGQPLLSAARTVLCQVHNQALELRSFMLSASILTRTERRKTFA